MFGSQYYKHPEILIASLGEMSETYEKTAKVDKNQLILFLERVYLRIWGIPEIGFQIRSLFFLSILQKNVPKRKFMRILDAGSGIGAYTLWLSNMYKDARVDGWEIDKHKLKFSQAFAKELSVTNAAFMYGNVVNTKLQLKTSYDLIVNIDVLEHIKNYQVVLRNFHNILSSGGYLYIHTPQKNQQRLFRALKHWHHEDHVHEGFDPEVLIKELKKDGFIIVETRETFGFFGKLAWELNHIILPKGFILMGFIYPFLYLLALLDLIINNHKGLGTAILAKKK